MAVVSPKHKRLCLYSDILSKDTFPPSQMRVSVIVPAHNAAPTLEACLRGVAEAVDGEPEVIVVDDGSRDATKSIGERLATKVVSHQRQGPAAARNAGARIASGEVLVFVDADVVVHRDAIDRLVKALDGEKRVVAAFGSYDSKPGVKGLVARYRNLLHAYTHQTGEREASTFWAGLGVVTRAAFERANGFDSHRFERASIEDIEFGMRLRAAGGRILLDPDAQGTHLKEWTLRSMVQTDLWCRAVPWTRLLRQSGGMPNDLNLRWHQRVSVAAVWLIPPALAISVADARLLAFVAALVACHAGLNARFFAWIARHASFGSMLRMIPLHWLFHWVAGLGFLIGQTGGSVRSADIAAPRSAERT